MRSTVLYILALAFATAAPVAAQTDDPIEALVAAERAEADLDRRRGKVRKAILALDVHMEDEPTDAASRTLRALCYYEQGKIERALRDAERALADARAAGDPRLVASCARNLSAFQSDLGRYDDAVTTLEPVAGEEEFLAPESDPRDAWALGTALRGRGDVDGAWRVFELGARAKGGETWQEYIAKARCEHAIGRIQAASRSVVAADDAAKEADGVEPDVLAMLAGLYFESEKEVDQPGKRSAGVLYREALELHPTHQPSLLGQFELHRYNRLRVSRSPEAILADLLAANPNSIDGLLADASADLSDGRLRAARETLARLSELAPGRRELVTLSAALAWVEHRREDCEGLLARLALTSPKDSRPEREVGRLLIELYRFAEALPFLERATERDPSDHEAWTYLGRALANTGREDEAREALDKGKKAAAGRQDAWRNNMMLVLKRMKAEHVVEPFGELSFSWQPDAAEVLRAYMLPYYRQARVELAERYGHTPGPTTIEVFREHGDFSVRSVGFEGFPALGVCFGPVVTALSPLSRMRGGFSWARTGFHEFSHVVHLGLSHNRCPRWITEGLATWEEVKRNPTWTRNMRRELIDARANGDLIPVRELNRAFRGPRIIFGYYQGGLLCEMLVEQHGFPPMVRLLEAFDRGLDLDQALAEVFNTTPEQVDAAFEEFVDARLEGLVIEPRWSTKRLSRLSLRLGKEPPAGDAERRDWTEGWATVAWGRWQEGRRVDAEVALRMVAASGVPCLRAQFLRGEMALDEDDPSESIEIWERAVAAGGRDYRALVGLGSLYEIEGDPKKAEEYFVLAESVFPGFDVQEFCAELKLVGLYDSLGREDDANAARERWLRWNAGVYGMRIEVARWHEDHDRWEEARRLYEEANEVDPFRRNLHVAWGDTLVELGRHEEALREYRVALLVPPELDLDHVRLRRRDEVEPGVDFNRALERAGIDPEQPPPAEVVVHLSDALKIGDPLSDTERAELFARMATSAAELGRDEDAADFAGRALELDPGNERAKSIK